MAIVFIRTLIVFLAILVSMRLMGKRQLGELELSELVVAVLISDMAAMPLQDIGIPLLNGLIPVLTLLCCEFILSGIIVRSIPMRRILCGKPSVLVENGIIVRSEMRKNRFTLDELCEELRNQSITDISKIKYAILETDGRLNTILFPAERPVTAAQMSIETEDPGYPIIVINDGALLRENLKAAGRDEVWLRRELRRHRAESARDVYFMSVNRAGQVYYVPMENEKL